MPYPELIVGGCVLLQALLLLPGRASRRAVAGRVSEVVVALAFVAAALILIFSLGVNGPAAWSMLEDQPLLRLPRAGLLLAALLLGRGIVASGEIPAGRKQEALFLLSLTTLFCDLLVLSRHALLSCFLLTAISWLGIFLAGLAFRGRVEGEAVLKAWTQTSVLAAVGFGAVLLLTVVSGGAHYDVIAQHWQAQAPYSPSALLVILALCLPYFLCGGIFPFQFLPMDREQGSPWAVQLIWLIPVQGAVTLAVWKTGVEVFVSPGGISGGMRVLQMAGLAGGFWLALFALSQDNSKRLFSALMGAQWSAVLVAGAIPSLLGSVAVSYAFSAIFLSGALLGFTWSRFQEAARGDNLACVRGAARTSWPAGLAFLVALTGPLCVPGFAGFPEDLHLLASMIEQRSLVLLLAEGALLVLVCASCLRIGADLLFRRLPEAATAPVPGASPQSAALDYAAMALLGSSLVLLGLLWHRVFSVLGEAAGSFLP